MASQLSSTSEAAGDGPPNWHRIKRLSDGTPVGKLGSVEYLLDGEGNAISDGYHEIRCLNGRYVGEIGASIEPIRLEEHRI